ncbi:hypothetical protein E2C01_084910 [Portunus trituberculatus]|uniref:Uncharacterized protein n=1 Tax=Portunus trituberculatus TaxID=210409 RepID=A0A5B7J7G9_PORTR|nr:hypothetical protein [Portunus trituberculatus]
MSPSRLPRALSCWEGVGGTARLYGDSPRLPLPPPPKQGVVSPGNISRYPVAGGVERDLVDG